MPELNDLIRDKQKYPDNLEIPVGEAKFTLGQLRAHQEATGQSVQQQLAEIEKERAALGKAQEQVVELWTKVQAERTTVPEKTAPQATTDWRTDPFFAPLAKDYGNVEGQLKVLNDNYGKVQQAMAAAVKYVADRFIENEYRSLPEDFRKETPLDKAVREAQEKKYFDQGGVPAVSRVYEEWARPRTEDRIRKEAYDKARADVERESAAAKVVSMKPGFVGASPGGEGKPPSKDFSEALSKAFQDPEILAGIAGGR